MGCLQRSPKNKEHGDVLVKGNIDVLADTHRSCSHSVGKGASFFCRGGSVDLCTPIQHSILVSRTTHTSCQAQAGSMHEPVPWINRVLLGGRFER